MKHHSPLQDHFAWLLLALCLSASAASLAAEPREITAQRLQRLDGFMRTATAADGYLGAVTLVAHQDKTMQWQAYGHRDLARRSPMEKDAIFRIYSMTKTVTTVAVLMLMEEGKLALDDPLEKHLPEFSGMQVYAAGTARAAQLRPAKRKITLHQLLTHTAGFATGGEGQAQANRLLERADLRGSDDLAEFARRLSRVPLAEEPGTRFNYDGIQLEILSRVVEVASGQRFDAFLQQRIFDPLRMHDTGFSVPAAKRDRIVDITRMGANAKLKLDSGPSASDPGVPLNPYFSGAGGLYSTAPDFLRFCRMLLDGGALDGVSLLSRKTVQQMMVNHLAQLDPPTTQFGDAEGFGLGGSVLLDPARRGRLGSVGQFGWSGAASTYFTIDPQERMIAILLMQHLPNEAANDLPRIATPFYNLVYQALP
jgi:CubicO group peptidase (beta-lactamase class C family)